MSSESWHTVPTQLKASTTGLKAHGGSHPPCSPVSCLLFGWEFVLRHCRRLDDSFLSTYQSSPAVLMHRRALSKLALTGLSPANVTRCTNYKRFLPCVPSLSFLFFSSALPTSFPSWVLATLPRPILHSTCSTSTPYTHTPTPNLPLTPISILMSSLRQSMTWSVSSSLITETKKEDLLTVREEFSSMVTAVSATLQNIVYWVADHEAKGSKKKSDLLAALIQTHDRIKPKVVVHMVDRTNVPQLLPHPPRIPVQLYCKQLPG